MIPTYAIRHIPTNKYLSYYANATSYSGSIVFELVISDYSPILLLQSKYEAEKAKTHNQDAFCDYKLDIRLSREDLEVVQVSLIEVSD
jgi:hypothetical protein